MPLGVRLPPRPTGTPQEGNWDADGGVEGACCWSDDATGALMWGIVYKSFNGLAVTKVLIGICAS